MHLEKNSNVHQRETNSFNVVWHQLYSWTATSWSSSLVYIALINRSSNIEKDNKALSILVAPFEWKNPKIYRKLRNNVFLGVHCIHLLYLHLCSVYVLTAGLNQGPGKAQINTKMHFYIRAITISLYNCMFYD